MGIIARCRKRRLSGGTQFGTSEKPWLTWAVNTLVPAHAANVTPMRAWSPFPQGTFTVGASQDWGAVETDTLRPVRVCEQRWLANDCSNTFLKRTALRWF